MTQTAMRVPLSDDHSLFREGLASLLKRRNIEIVATGDGGDAVPQAVQFKPHVILLDLRMPEVHGLEVLAQFQRRQIATPIVMLITSAKQECRRFSQLTPREMEILGHLAEGQGNKVIARNLDISDGTVKLHMKAILRKLKVQSRVEAAVMAVHQGVCRGTKIN